MKRERAVEPARLGGNPALLERVLKEGRWVGGVGGVGGYQLVTGYATPPAEFGGLGVELLLEIVLTAEIALVDALLCC